ncbi:hypothetical protein J2S76_004413, partial [Ancylobacter vacuolatus]|nr:hypothetical protein [Ancylobacter vacuolatus]
MRTRAPLRVAAWTFVLFQTGISALLAQDVSAQLPPLPHDLSPWGMFLAADWVVKAVMIGLAFASVV